MIHLDDDILCARILIVDDQRPNVQLLERTLAESGYTQVMSTMNPAEVFALHSADRFDLILLDLQMPVMDGFAVMEGLKADPVDPYLPVIVRTAQPGHKLRALQAGAKDFISKPFDLLEVKTRTRNMLEVRKLYPALARQNDVLELRVAERTVGLRDSEAKFRSLTELAADWYSEQNGSGTFTQVSSSVQEMLGLRVTDFLGTRVGDAGAGRNDDERQALQAAIAGRQPFLDFVFSRVNADGTTQQFRVSGEPMFSASCAYVGYRGIGSEVTGRV